MGWTAVSQILVILGSKYAGISLFQLDITELFNIELMEWFLVQKVAFEIRDNSIQASSSYAGPSVYAKMPNELWSIWTYFFRQFFSDKKIFFSDFVLDWILSQITYRSCISYAII